MSAASSAEQQTSLAARYQIGSSDPLDLLVIEQESWHRYTGKVTRQEMARLILSWLNNGDYEAKANCATDGKTLLCRLLVWPRVAGLVYEMLASWGSLSLPVIEMVEETELLQFHLTDAERPRHPVRQLLSVSWADECYDATGQTIVAPELSLRGHDLRANRKVYGTAEIRYLAERHSYLLNIPRREEAYDKHFEATVAGVYSGGLNWLQVQMPPGIEAFENDPDYRCGGSSSGHLIEPEDDDSVPEPDGRDYEVIVDYCSQEVISDGAV